MEANAPKFSPGPWEVYLRNRVVANVTHHGALAGALHDAVADCRDSRNPEADAALIAMAPEMLAALVQVVVEHDMSGADWDTAGITRARAVVALAQSEQVTR